MNKTLSENQLTMLPDVERRGLSVLGVRFALSVRQPWAWLIVNGHKDIENRDWWTSRRGSILIHASKGMAMDEYYDCQHFASLIDKNIHIPLPEKLERGGIIGAVDLVDCVNRSESKWFQGVYGFVLRNPQKIDFSPYRGALGFFKVGQNDA